MYHLKLSTLIFIIIISMLAGIALFVIIINIRTPGPSEAVVINSSQNVNYLIGNDIIFP